MKFKEIKNMTLVQIWDKIQKPFNFAWRTGVIVIAVCMVCGLLSELIGWLWGYVEREPYDIEYISDNVKAEYYTDGTCCLYDRNSDKKLSKKLKFVESCPMTGDSLTSYLSLEGKWGFIDINSGKTVIPAAYKKVWAFNEGLAAVADETNKVGFIDKAGQLVIPMMEVDWKDGYYLFENGLCVVTHVPSGKKGAIDKNGNWVLPMEFDTIYSPYDNGFMKVGDGEHWGLYDSTGKEVFPIEYDDIYYDEGYDRVFINRDGVKQLVSVTGEVIEPFIVDRIRPLNYIAEYNPDSTNVIATHPYLVEYEIDSQRGVLDSRTSKVIIPAIYDEIEMVSKTTIKASLDLEHIESVIYDIHGNKLPNSYQQAEGS